MLDTVAIPVWLLALIGLFAAWAVLDRLLVPSVRWVLRSRVNRVLDEIGGRLDIEIPPFALTKRRVLVERLMYDPEVQRAAEDLARAEGMPREVAMARVERYAREIVPAFNAYVYFRVGYWLAKRLAQLLYRVRLGYADDAGMAAIDPKSTPVFIMNHRSNMDYVLVTFLAAERTALSYAVGEWARIWPLQTLIRAMGGFFVRRNSGNPLYRKVLERYVGMATRGGVCQAVYPEGGLSRDGRVRAPRIGLLDYMLRDFDPEGERDLVFIPVGINYDRVLEDRTLLLTLDPEAERARAVPTTLKFLGHNFALMLRRRWHRFGYACVNFGTPISVRAYARAHGIDFAGLDTAARIAEVERLAATLMEEVKRVIPVLPVSLIATVFRRNQTMLLTALEIKAGALAIMQDLEESGARIYIPRENRDYAITVGLRMLTLRHVVAEEEGFLTVNADNRLVLDYYANAIEHLLETPADSDRRTALTPGSGAGGSRRK